MMGIPKGQVKEGLNLYGLNNRKKFPFFLSSRLEINGHGITLKSKNVLFLLQATAQTGKK